MIGPNGAGKTTMLSAIMACWLEGHGIDGSIEAVPESSASSPAVRTAPEKRELSGEMSVEDNLRPRRLPAATVMGHRDHPKTPDDNLGDLFPRPKERCTQLAGTLSGGER